MTAPQLQSNVTTSYREEPAFGGLASNDSQARDFPANTGGGLMLDKRTVTTNRIRTDLQTERPKHGARSVAGSLSSDLAVGTFDPILAAAFRANFSSTLVSSTFAATYDTATKTLTRSTGTWAGDGFKVGDAIILSVAVGNNANKPAIICSFPTSTTAVMAVDNWVDVVAAAGVTATRGKKLVMGASPVARSFTIEHWQPGITVSERYLGCRLASIGFGMPAEGPVGIDTSWIGQDMAAIASTRWFTNSVAPTTPVMVTADAIISYRGQRVLTVQNASLSWDTNVTAPINVGSRTAFASTDGNATVAASLSFMRTGSTNLAALQDETGPYSMAIMFRDTANGYICLSVPAFTLGGAGVSERIGPSGFQIETVPLLIGPGTASDVDASMITLTTSAA